MAHSDNLAQLLKDTVDRYILDQTGPLTESINTLKTELNDTKIKVGTLEATNAALNDNLSVKSAQVISLTTQLQQAQTEITRLTNLLAEQYDVRPGQDIQSAINARAEGETIKLAPGEYLLSAPLTLKNNQKLIGNGWDTTFVRGSVPITNFIKQNYYWVASDVLPPAYTDAGQCEINSGTGANPCQKREDLFATYPDISPATYRRLQRVMSLTEMGVGQYFADYATNKLYVYDEPRNVVMAKTPFAINSAATGCQVSGISFEQFATPSQLGAVTVTGTNWEIDNCMFRDNHASGLHLSGSHNTKVHHNAMIANGQAGMTHHRSNNTEITYNNFTYNNTAGYYARDWESAGFKATYSAGVKFQYNEVINNTGVGVWFDIDNTDYLVTDNTVDGNFSCGIRLEISFSGEVARNVVTRNGIGHAGPGRGSDFSAFATAGIHVNSAGGMGAGELKIHDNLIGVILNNGVYVAAGYGNQNAIHVEQRDRGKSVTYPQLTWTARNVKVYNNKVNITKVAGKEGTGVAGLGILGSTGSQVYLPATGNTFENNEYFNTNLTDVQFHCMDGTATNRYRTFARWQQLGYDKTGKLTVYSAP